MQYQGVQPLRFVSLVGDVRRTLAVRRLSRRFVTRAEQLCAPRVQNRAGMRIRTSGESEWRLGLYDVVGELVEYVERERRNAPAWRRAKWWLLGRSEGEA